MNLNEKEILKNTIGVNDDGDPTSSICLNLSFIESDFDNVRDINNIAVYSPIVNIQTRNGFVQIDLKFNNPNNPDMKKIWNCLEQYGKETSKDREPDDLSVPCLNLTIVPLVYNGNYFWVCVNPIMWTIQPEFPGSSNNNLLRILFEAQSISLIKTNEIDIDEIDNSINREYAEIEYREEQMLRIKEEEASYIEERNKKLEEARRKKG